MSKEVKLLTKSVIKYDLGIGIILSLLLFMIFGKGISIAFFTGIIIATINFGVSGFVLDRSLNTGNYNTKIVLPISFVVRIFFIAFIALLFVEKLSYLLSYLGGYISHFPILILYWTKTQKGSD